MFAQDVTPIAVLAPTAKRFFLPLHPALVNDLTFGRTSFDGYAGEVTCD
jgi:hypothetical protein